MMHSVTLIVLLGPTINAQFVVNAQTYGLRNLPPSTNRFRTSQFVKPMLQHQEFRSRRSIFAQAESPGKSEDGLMAFEASITGNPIMGEKIEVQEFPGSQWEKGVRNLNPEKKKGDAPGPFLRMKEATQRQIGKECSEGDLQQATKDLSGLDVGDVAAILRKDGKFYYAKLTDRIEPGGDLPEETTPEPKARYDYTYKLPLAAMQSSPMISNNSAVALIGFFVGSGVMFAVFHFRRGALPEGKSPLLVPM